jgi:peptidoglycan/LPS O-acetylase OafA/YrhL
MTQSQSKGLYRPDIDGLRAIAILSVVLYHAGVSAAPGGFTGVDIFFVISGYLIGGHIYGELHTGSFSFLRFYQRRAKRILPAFYAVLAFTLLAGLLLMSAHEFHFLAASAFAATLSISNIFFLRYLDDYFNGGTGLHPLLMTWSLGVEEQFYAVIPLLMFLLARIRRRLLLPAILLLCLLSFLLACWQVHNLPSRAFYLLPARAWELGAGVALAVMEQTRQRLRLTVLISHLASVLGLLLLLAPIFLLNAHSIFPGLAALPSVLGAALLIAIPYSWINRRLLSLPPLVFIGRISYSWYLWHWPLLACLRIAGNDTLTPTAGMIAVAASLGIAVLSYHFIEQPFRTSQRPARPLLFRYALVSFAALVLCGGIWFSDKIPHSPSRFPDLDRIEKETGLAYNRDCLASGDQLNFSSQCYDGADRRTLVAIWGDSHSNALAPELRSIAAESNLGFAQISHSACLPLMEAAYYVATYPETARTCMAFNQRAMNFLLGNPQIRTVILAGRWALFFPPGGGDGWAYPGAANGHQMLTQDEAGALFRRSLSTSVERLLQAGKQVVILEDSPTFDFIPLNRFRTSQIPARRLLAKWLGSEEARDLGCAQPAELPAVFFADAQLKEADESLPGVPLIDLLSEFRQGNGLYAYRIGDHQLYDETRHLTRYGAHFALRDFHLPALKP